MADSPIIQSINEPHTSRPSLSPGLVSINEPPQPPPGAPEHPVGGPPAKTVHGAADPDELEDELEQAEEEGDFEPMHRSPKAKR